MRTSFVVAVLVVAVGVRCDPLVADQQLLDQLQQVEALSPEAQVQPFLKYQFNRELICRNPYETRLEFVL